MIKKSGAKKGGPGGKQKARGIDSGKIGVDDAGRVGKGEGQLSENELGKVSGGVAGRIQKDTTCRIPWPVPKAR
jgi:hypothetical protein